ncbi:transporter substrate-binding domain-containing protein [Kitasatospora sp. NPDC004240]
MHRTLMPRHARVPGNAHLPTSPELTPARTPASTLTPVPTSASAPMPAPARRVSRRPLRAAAALGAGGLLLTGCGGEPGPAPGGQDDLRGRLPEAVRTAGVLKIGSYLNYVPVDFRDAGGNPAGLDPDLANAVAAHLGLRVEFVDMPFEKLIPAVQRGEVDMAMSAIIDTRQRQLGATDDGRQDNPGVDFVDYFHTSTSIVVRTGNPQNISTLDSLCGFTVAIQRGTVQDELATRQAAACSRFGKSLQIHRTDSDEQALAEVLAGTAVADLNDYPVAEYNIKQPQRGGRFQIASTRILQSGSYGVTFAKGNGRLRDVVAKTLDQLMRNGEYDKVLDKWNVRGGGISSAVVNSGL